jgi:hypothetical protein
VALSIDVGTVFNKQRVLIVKRDEDTAITPACLTVQINKVTISESHILIRIVANVYKPVSTVFK